MSEKKQPTELEDAWVIINVLILALADHGDAMWPRALEWLQRNEEHKPKE